MSDGDDLYRQLGGQIKGELLEFISGFDPEKDDINRFILDVRNELIILHSRWRMHVDWHGEPHHVVPPIYGFVPYPNPLSLLNVFSDEEE